MTHRFSFVLVTVLVLAGAVSRSQQPTQPAGSTVTPADYLRWSTELRNWGRWGPNDQKGPANLITPQKVLAATRLVRAGDGRVAGARGASGAGRRCRRRAGVPSDHEQHRRHRDDR